MLPARFVPIAAAVLSVCGFAHAEPDAAAKAKVESMANALKAAKTLKCSVELHGEGAMFAAFVPKAKSDVVMQKVEGKPDVWMYRVSGKADMLGQPTTDYLVVCDGERKSWLEKEQKLLMERANAAAGGQQIDMANTTSIHDMISAEAVQKAVAAPNITAEPDAKVSGVDCSVIVIDQADTRPAVRWSIANTDHLPRKIERLMRGGGMNDAQVWTISDVVVDGPIPEGSFAISLPPGYTLSSANSANPGTAPRPRAIGINPDDLAPEFELKDAAGATVKLSSLRGNVVVLDFWGTWCLPCKKASPEIQKLADEYKSKPVKIYGLAVRESSDDKPIAYMTENKYTYGLLLKGDDTAKTYRVKVFPSYFVIGKAGEIVYSTNGYDEKTFPALKLAIEAALEGKPLAKPAAPKPMAPVSGGGDDAASDGGKKDGGKDGGKDDAKDGGK